MTVNMERNLLPPDDNPHAVPCIGCYECFDYEELTEVGEDIAEELKAEGYEPLLCKKCYDGMINDFKCQKCGILSTKVLYEEHKKYDVICEDCHNSLMREKERKKK